MKKHEKERSWNDYAGGGFDYDSLGTYSATECTGLIPNAPVDDDEFEAYNDLFRFRHQDVRAQDDTLKNPVNKMTP